MSDKDEYIKIAVFSDPVEAELLRGLLEAQDLKVLLSKEAVGQVWGLSVGSAAETDVYVPGSQEAAARAIVREYFSGANFEEGDKSPFIKPSS
jgi:hypothetical protein